MIKPAADSSPRIRQVISSFRTSAAGLFCATVALAITAGCATPQSGVSVRKNGSAPTKLGDGDILLPRAGLAFQIAPLDKVRVQILPIAVADGSLAVEPHDVLHYEFALHGGDYHVMPGDDLTVHFGGDPKADISVIVRPDGKITLANVAEVQTVGKTPAQLATEVEGAYRDRLNKPAVSVTVNKSNLALAELSGEATVQPDGTITIARLGEFSVAGQSSPKVASALSEAASKYFGNSVIAQVSRTTPKAEHGGLIGFDKSISVSVDGLLGIPEIGFLNTKGKSTQDIQKEIEEALKNRYKNPLAVLVAIEASEARVVYVDGEVGRPGAYPLTPSMTALKALTVAGGLTPTGSFDEVLVIHRNETNDVFVYVTNLAEFIEKGIKGNDLALSPQDIVMVPKTSVAKANLWIDQYINRMLPFSRSVSYSYNQGETRLNTP